MKKILVVDDSELSREKVRALLIKEGYEVLSANNAKEGILLFKESPGINLIISDVNMPDMDGLTMCETIKKIAEEKMPPVFMFTARTNEEVKSRAKAVGVQGWILKPFEEIILVEVVTRILKK